MSDKFIPIKLVNAFTPPRQKPQSSPLNFAPGLLVDQLNRPLRDLRISVTDRCNFRCTYCMPKEVFDTNYQYLPHSHLLSFEEITRLAKLFARQGVQKIRIKNKNPRWQRFRTNTHHQRLLARAQSTRAQRCRTQPRHRLPRRA